MTGHDPERRVLDPAFEAVIAHHAGGYRVSAGEGFLVFMDSKLDLVNFDAASYCAYQHNAHNGHPIPEITERRSS